MRAGEDVRLEAQAEHAVRLDRVRNQLRVRVRVRARARSRARGRGRAIG